VLRLSCKTIAETVAELRSFAVDFIHNSENILAHEIGASSVVAVEVV